MTVPRDKPYLYATWPTRYITGDKSCLWACWYKTHCTASTIFAGCVNRFCRSDSFSDC